MPATATRWVPIRYGASCRCILVALAPASSLEILAWRIVLSLVLCVLILVAMGQLQRAFAVLRDRRSALLLPARQGC